MKRKPELLCPAGTPEALDAAVEGGADAIYLGGAMFNARMNAQNFGGDALHSAVLRAHSYGVKIYLTLNTLIYDREIKAFLEEAKRAQEAGVDALIVADLGGLTALKQVLPNMELHASTQMSGHNSDAAKALAHLGCSRMVVAREISLDDLKTVVRESPIEIEAFAHGALCVCHSGQCLFSSVVGGRSGNRGECAQPCRLPYTVGGKQSYPLSLKDLSLASFIPELIESGVASLKIEGRMKSPEYVYACTKTFRKLLDEERPATKEELSYLSDTFSRGGFTAGYFTSKIGSEMLGIRSDSDKDRSRAQEPFCGLKRKIPLDAKVSIKTGIPMKMTLSDGKRSVTVAGEIPLIAQNAPATEEGIRRSLSKFGGTAYEIGRMEIELENGLMIPVSKLNELRRAASAALENERKPENVREVCRYTPNIPKEKREGIKTARFQTPDSVTERARAYFNRIYLPLTAFDGSTKGVILPPVIFDHEKETVKEKLLQAKALGATHVLVGNLGHLSFVKETGLIPVGDYRLNATNQETVASLEKSGVKEMILSPEMTLPQIRDVGGNTAVIVYGRIPLMTLEKCIGKELGGCEKCTDGKLTLTDRKGISFPVLREYDHRSVIFNSLPTNLSDKQNELKAAGISAQHFLFSVETKREVDEVISAFQNGSPLPQKVRRIPS